MSPKPPAALVDNIRRQRCVLFVGAGLSMQAGLPSWGRLLRIMVEQVKAGVPDSPTEELESLLQRNKFLEVAEYCKEQLGKNQFANILAENVSGRDGPISEAHRLIANTPFAGVITTNYDKLLERG